EDFVPLPLKRREHDDRNIEVIGASENNLKNVSAKFPIGVMTVVTGVSGSGKSTLVNEILYKSLAKSLYKGKHRPGKHKEVKGLEHIEKVMAIDQSPIGLTPRSNPATSTRLLDDIRNHLPMTNEA